MYANDSSNFRQVPIGVVIPRTADDIVTTHRACAQLGAPIVNRGGGTSLSGETVNHAVVIDTSKYMTAVEEPDGEAGTVRAQPGAINEQVNQQVGPKVNMVFGPDPSSHSRCTIGGNLGNNSCGIHSVQSQLYGPGPRTSDNTDALEVVTYEGERFWVGVGEEDRLEAIIAAGGRKGEIYRQLRDLRDRYAGAIREGMKPVSELPRRVSGYNLDELLPERGFNVARALVGTESTGVTVSSAVLKLTPAMLMRTLVVVEYDDLPSAGDHVQEMIERFRPIGLEGIDRELIHDQQKLDMNLEEIAELPRPEGEAWLLVQLGSDSAQESEGEADRLVAWLVDDKDVPEERIKVLRSSQEGGHSGDIWKLRKSGLGSTAFPPDGDHWPGWEDSAVPPAKIGPYLRDLRALYDAHGLRGSTYGHFGQGCIHSRIDFDLRSADGLAAPHPLVRAAARRARGAGRLACRRGRGDEMIRPAVVLGAWGCLLAGLAGLLAAFPFDALAVALLGGAAASMLLLALLMLPTAPNRESSEAQAIPDLSLATALAGIALCCLVVGAEVGLWLVLIGGGLLMLALAGLIRERRAQRDARRKPPP